VEGSAAGGAQRISGAFREAEDSPVKHFGEEGVEPSLGLSCRNSLLSQFMHGGGRVRCCVPARIVEDRFRGSTRKYYAAHAG